MKHLKQDKGYNCTQTCLAMMSNKSIREVENIVGHDESMDIVMDVINTCEKLNIPVDEGWVDIKPNLIYSHFYPSNCFVFVRNRCNRLNGHMIVRYNNKFYDPNGMTYRFLLRRYIFMAYLEIRK